MNVKILSIINLLVVTRFSLDLNDKVSVRIVLNHIDLQVLNNFWVFKIKTCLQVMICLSLISLQIKESLSGGVSSELLGFSLTFSFI